MYIWAISVCCFVLDDLDELEVYGADTKGTELASYSFEVCVLNCNSEI